jgi:UDP-N-acetylglucosamine transferase subunit ALG13
MILVLLGTQDSPFPRILRETEEAVKHLGLKDEIYAQIGTTNYHSTRMHIKDYYVGDEYEKLFRKADIIIAHGGAGVLFKAMHLGKKVIAMPRLAELGEHNESHQGELVTKLAEGKYIYEAKGTITDALLEINSFQPRPYDLHNDIAEQIEDYIESI